jgi:hypothetical protein
MASLTTRDDLLRFYDDIPEGQVKTSLRGLVANLARAKDPALVEFISTRVLDVLDHWLSSDPVVRFQDAVAEVRRRARRTRRR